MHDTFEWIRINCRAIWVLLIPALVLCVASTFFVDFGASKYMQSTPRNFFTDALSMLIPFNMYFGVHKYDALLVYVVLTAASTAMAVPAIRKYFYYHRSLKHLTMGKAFSMVGHDWRKAAVCALIMTVMCAGFLKITLWVMVPLLWFFVSIFPCVVMGQRLSVVTTGIFRMLKDIAMAVFFFCVVQAIPTLCLMVIIYAFYFLGNVLPGGLDAIGGAYSLISIATTFLMCVAYCVSIVVLIVNLVIIHGARYYYPQFDTH